MYIPASFAVTDPGVLHDFVREHSFGLLLSHVAGEMFGTHVPFLLDAAAGPHGALLGHVARANPQWRELAGQSALAVFTGPHAYVSPTWYETPHMVPTWNYTAVHVTGRVEIIEEPSELLAILSETVRVYERNRPNPWSFDGSTTQAERLMAQIVGFRIVIDKIEGKFKLNQNHPEERREKVIRALGTGGDENSRAVAELMRRSMTPSADQP